MVGKAAIASKAKGAYQLLLLAALLGACSFAASQGGSSSVYSCVSKQDASGGQPAVLDADDEAVCRAACDSNSECEFYVYYANRCFLKNNYDMGGYGDTGPREYVQSLCIKGIVTCTSQPPNPDNGQFACPDSAAFGSSCNATCNTGFTGAPSVSCDGRGQWSDVAGSCTAVTCTIQPANPDNGQFACPASAAFGARCDGTCNTGFTGAPSVTCDGSGTWKMAGNCTAVCVSPPPVNSPKHATWTTCGSPSPLNSKVHRIVPSNCNIPTRYARPKAGANGYLYFKLYRNGHLGHLWLVQQW